MAFADVMDQVYIGFWFSSAEEAEIEAALEYLYNNSTTAQTMLETLVSEDKTLNIYYEEGKFEVPYEGLGNGIMHIDIDFLDGKSFINPEGKAIAYALAPALAHEMGHAIYGLVDSPLEAPNLAGENVEFINDIHDELSIDQRLSYDGVGASPDVVSGTNYTGGQAIDVAVVVSHVDGYAGTYYASAHGHMEGSRDLIIGNGGADNLFSGDGNDYLYGKDGDDFLDAGAGLDEITTGDGEDIIWFDFNPTDYDKITDFTIGEDKINLSTFHMFRDDVEANAVQSGGDVLLFLGDHVINVQGVSKTSLFDNSTFDSFIGLIESDGNLVEGTSSNETLNAADGATTYSDIFKGHGGNDLLYGLAGSDLYIYELGDGSDTIYETPSLAETNVIRLDGISSTDVYLDNATSNDLVISVDDGTVSGSVRVDNQWYGDESTGGYEIKYLQMDDKIIDLTGGLLYRGDGPGQGDTIKARSDIATNDTMDGGDGNDQLYGYDGDDTYIFAAGYGHDIVRDEGAGTGNNILKIGEVDHSTPSGNDRTFYLDNTNTDYIKIIDFALGSWEVI